MLQVQWHHMMDRGSRLGSGAPFHPLSIVLPSSPRCPPLPTGTTAVPELRQRQPPPQIAALEIAISPSRTKKNRGVPATKGMSEQSTTHLVLPLHKPLAVPPCTFTTTCDPEAHAMAVTALGVMHGGEWTPRERCASPPSLQQLLPHAPFHPLQPINPNQRSLVRL